MTYSKLTITLAMCCGICLTILRSASADFVGVTTANKDDSDTNFLCIQGNGEFVPGPLTVCNVYAAFDDPSDRLLSVGVADLQVYDEAKPDVFFQHPLILSAYPPACLDIQDFPDLICDSFVALGQECYYDSWLFSTDGDFDSSEFAFNGHIVGGWHTSDPDNGQGDAGTYPDLQVLFLQTSVAQGLSLLGDIHIFWKDQATGEIFAEVDVPIECAAVVCPANNSCDDGDACTMKDQCIDGVCTGVPINCDDSNVCTDDYCDPRTGQCVYEPNDDACDDGDPCTANDQCGEDGCVHGTPIVCPEGQVCESPSGECVEEQDPCECVDGRVTLCHIPPGNPGNAHTLAVGCAARDKHLAHGDTCGPCE